MNDISPSAEKRPRIGIYPGTFDPMTKGHLHIIKRASRLVDHLIIGVATNLRKGPIFSDVQRMALVQQDISTLPTPYCTIEVKQFSGLLIDFAKHENASCIFRGLRAVSDFEYEFQMTGMNAKLDPDIETVFLMASDKWQFVSSSFVKEICALGGDVSEFLTPATLKQLKDRLAETA